ncbi:MAG: class I adenylate-forming enzyme family protein [Planctomycetota bacterium]
MKRVHNRAAIADQNPSIFTRTSKRDAYRFLTLDRIMSDSGEANGSHHRRHRSSTAAKRPTEYARLSDAFFATAHRFADRPALVTRKNIFCYADLAHQSLCIAEHLLADDRYRPGDRIVVMLDNGPEFIAAYYGVLAAGGVVVPLPANIEWCRLERIARMCNVRNILSSQRIVGRRPEIAPRACVPLDRAGARPLRVPHVEPFRIDNQSLAMILFTSGSSGDPKGVMLSDRNLLSNTESILGYLPITHTDRTLALLPFYHAFGHSILQTHLLSGATLVVDGRMVFPTTVVDALEHHGATSFSAVPEGFYSLLTMSDLGDRDLPHLKYMSVAGGALKSDSVVEVARRIAPAEFYVMYGQTEASARLAYLPPQLAETHPDSIGRAIPGVQLRVFDEQGQEAKRNETGELCARGDNVMLGYWNDPETTRRVLHDGWLRTGDLASRDEEGFFHVKARNSDLVKVQGFRVHPREIEETISRHFSEMRVIVVPYQRNGTTRLALYGITAKKARHLADELRNVCSRELPRHKVPSFVEVLPRAPINASMKLDRTALKRHAEYHSSTGARHCPESGTPRRLPA